jgi:hypothetical protein
LSDLKASPKQMGRLAHKLRVVGSQHGRGGTN